MDIVDRLEWASDARPLEDDLTVVGPTLRGGRGCAARRQLFTGPHRLECSVLAAHLPTRSMKIADVSSSSRLGIPGAEC